MDNTRFVIIAGVGCLVLILLVAIAVPIALFFPARVQQMMGARVAPTPISRSEIARQAVPTLTPASQSQELQPTPLATPQAPVPQAAQESELSALPSLYERVNPGVVSIQVIVERQGMTGSGAGSGFILDDEGHIITNDHVVAPAENILVVFYNGFQARASIVGTDADSDLAVLKVDELPDGVHPLSLADSDEVKPGDLTIAIGNPFGQQGSMTQGIVSAVGRMIPSLAEGFSIPQAIQTDAAVNPGNSGGPLLNMDGQVIGVNAQIRSGGARANSGVGFAVPSNIVRRVVPVLIEEGSYVWPWLGISGPPGGVNLYIAQANDLDTQRGAYIHEVISGGPAEGAGLEGSTGSTMIDDIEWPVGGDVVVEADGEPVIDFSDLLNHVVSHRPGDTMELTIIRDGQRQQVTAELQARPESFQPGTP